MLLQLHRNSYCLYPLSWWHMIVDKQWNRYGDRAGMFRTHLFRAPSIIVYTPPISKFVLFSEDKFIAEWPTFELTGWTSLSTVHGKAHTRLCNIVTNTINRPEALKHIVTALQSWTKGQSQSKVWNPKGIYTLTFTSNNILDSKIFYNQLYDMVHHILVGITRYV